jgi:uncharacterized protein
MAASSSLFVDTSAWVSLIGEDEALHTEVTEAYRQAFRERRPLLTANFMIAEVVAVLTSRRIVSRERLVAFVDALKAASQLTIEYIDRSTDEAAWALIKSRMQMEWSLADASSFVLMQRDGITEALTLDYHFEQAGYIRLPVT